ncbi:hypothetical protein Unana1_00700 [Umbelopsis nana]
MAHELFDVNFFGVLSTIQAVAPFMVKQGSGKIINIGSINAWMVQPFGVLYAATKSAVHSLSDDLRMELKPFNIQVVVVAPGGVRSNIAKNAGTRYFLPSDSIYSKMEDIFEDRVRNSPSQGISVGY